MTPPQAASKAKFRVEWLGEVPYREALALQEATVAARRNGQGEDVLFLLEHPSVITLGRSAQREHLLASEEALAAQGVEVHEAARGGDITFHGPGQLVGYLILNLTERGQRDVHRHLRQIESGLIAVLAELGIRGETREGWTGVFVESGLINSGLKDSPPPRKIASIGVGVRGWVTFHGFGLNVTTDLAQFDPIVPCGLHGVQMTSVAQELALTADSALEKRCRGAVERVFQHFFG